MKHLLPTRHLLTLLLTCFMALGAQAEALEYYVSAKTGNDGRNGTSWNSAFKTIKAALQAAESNANTQAKIYLAEGEYDVSETNAINYYDGKKKKRRLLCLVKRGTEVVALGWLSHTGFTNAASRYV